MTSAPTVRLALMPHQGSSSVRHEWLKAPMVRLAIGTGQGDVNGTLKGRRGFLDSPVQDESNAPALLVSFVYVDEFLKRRKGYRYRNWAMDSGAFTAYQSGKPIHLGDFIRSVRELQMTDSTLTEVYSLDVIGDWKASLRNTELMWKAGVQAIPCYHVGEPLDALKGMARDYPKIALGGVAYKNTKQKTDWAIRCMSAVWPKRVHGFGFGSAQALLKVPFHSVDATTWEVRPCQYGYWQTFGARVNVRGSRQNLRGEVNFYLELEAKARARWRREMSELEAA